MIRAGTELLVERPIDAIAIDDIVATARVSKGSFFNHFKDKAAFGEALAGEIRAEVEAKVTTANLAVTDPAERVARGVAGYIRFALTDPKRTRVMLRGLDWLSRPEHPLNQGLQADIALGVARGRFRRRAANDGALYVIGLCSVVVVAVIAERMSLTDARRMSQNILVLALAGLGAPEGEAVTLVEAVLADVLATKRVI